mgnify:CR=1 FL=1
MSDNRLFVSATNPFADCDQQVSDLTSEPNRSRRRAQKSGPMQPAYLSLSQKKRLAAFRIFRQDEGIG